MPAALYEKTIGFTASSEYAYVRMEMKSGQVFYLTSLLIPGLPLPKNIRAIGRRVKRMSAFPRKGGWTKDPTKANHLIDSIRNFLDKID